MNPDPAAVVELSAPHISRGNHTLMCRKISKKPLSGRIHYSAKYQRRIFLSTISLNLQEISAEECEWINTGMASRAPSTPGRQPWVPWVSQQISLLWAQQSCSALGADAVHTWVCAPTQLWVFNFSYPPLRPALCPQHVLELGHFRMDWKSQGKKPQTPKILN